MKCASPSSPLGGRHVSALEWENTWTGDEMNGLNGSDERLVSRLTAGSRYYDGRTKSWINRWALSNPR